MYDIRKIDHGHIKLKLLFFFFFVFERKLKILFYCIFHAALAKIGG